MNCNDCPRRCRVDRESGGIGFCGGGSKARIAKTIDPFEYEEPCLGDVTAVFFGGCTLKCSYCQNRAISRGAVGAEYDDAALAELFDGARGALDLVTPTHYSREIARALGLCKKRHDVIYNTSGYETTEAVKRASEFTSVFLTDLKYADGDISKRFSGAEDYFRHASRAIRQMRKIPDEWTTVNGKRILKRGLIVRHLVLPDCAADSLCVLDWIAENLGTETIVSIMSQFTPNGFGEPKRSLKKLEYKLVVEHAVRLGFKNGYIQELSSASDTYIPSFR